MDFVNRSFQNQITEVEENGETFLEVPAVLLNETILEGHPEGDIAVTEDELSKWPGRWNDVAITIGHPRKNGQPVSAKKEPIKKNKLVGRTKNARFEKGELKADLKLKKNELEQSEAGEIVLKKLNSDELVELSTGYGSDTVETNIDGADGQHVNIVPDHVALLPRSKGKCSVEDGCGLPRNEQLLTENLLSTSRTEDDLIFDEPESADWSEVDKNLGDYVEAFFEFTDNSRDDFEGADFGTVESLPDEISQWISQHTLLGDADAESVRELIFFPVVNPNTNNLNQNALEAVITGRGETADIDDSTLASAQGAARTMLTNIFDRDLEENEMNEDEVAESIWEKFISVFTNKNKLEKNQQDFNIADLLSSVSNVLDQPESQFMQDMEENYEFDAGNQVPTEIQAKMAAELIGISTGEALQLMGRNRENSKTTEDKQMKQNEELIESLCDNEAVPFSCNELEQMENEQLEALNEKFSEQEEQYEEDEQPKTNEQPEGNDLELNEEDVEMVKQVAQEKREEKSRLVDQLSENARCSFNEDELEEKSIEELNKIAEMVDVDVNRSANGKPETKQNETESAEDYSSPSVLMKSNEEDE